MLVYLDTAQLADFDAATRNESEVASRFLQTWTEVGCQLALSARHLHEMAQIADDARLEHRLASLGRFPMVSFGWEDPVALEAILQIGFLGVTGTFDVACGLAYEPTIRPRIFPPCEISHIRAEVLQNRDFALSEKAERDRFAALEDKFRKDRETWRRMAKRRLVTKTQQSVARRDKRATPLEREVIAASRAQKIAEYDLADYDFVSSVFDAEEIDAIVAFFLDPARDAITSNQSLSPDRRERHLELLKRLAPHHAPGLSCRLAVERRMWRDSRRFTAAEFVDLHHISYAPYVDLAFADDAIAGYFEVEVREHPEALSPFANPTLRRGPDLEATRQAILDCSARV